MLAFLFGYQRAHEVSQPLRHFKEECIRVGHSMSISSTYGLLEEREQVPDSVVWTEGLSYEREVDHGGDLEGGGGGG